MRFSLVACLFFLHICCLAVGNDRSPRMIFTEKGRKCLFFFLFLAKIKHSVNMSHKAENRENLLNHVK